MRRFLIPVALLLLTSVTGCGSSESGSSATVAATNSQIASTATEAGLGVPPPGEPWDVLFVASRFEVATDYVVTHYEQLAEESLGVDVRVKNAEVGGATAWEVLQQIRNVAFPGMAGEVTEAEIIIVVVYPQRSDGNRATHIDEERDKCQDPLPVGDTEPPDPGVVATAEFWEPYRVLLDQIYTEIWRMRGGTPTVLVAGDVNEGDLATQRNAGIEEECRAWFEAWSDTARETAEAHGAKWVSLYDLLNGPGHDIVPLEMGWTGPSEQQPTLGIRKLNDIGSAMVADALAAVGFVQQPCRSDQKGPPPTLAPMCGQLSALPRTERQSQAGRTRTPLEPTVRVECGGLSKPCHAAVWSSGVARRWYHTEPNRRMRKVSVDGGVGMDATRCVVAEFLASFGMSGLCQRAICDQGACSAAHHGIVFAGSGTSAGGADRCDFRYHMLVPWVS